MYIDIARLMINFCYNIGGTGNLPILIHKWMGKLKIGLDWILAGNTKGGSIIVPLTSCLTDLD